MRKKSLYGLLIVMSLCLGACSKPTTQATMDNNSAQSQNLPESAATESEPESLVKPEPVITKVTISAAGDVTLGTNQKQGYEMSFHEMYDDKGATYFLQNVRDIFAADDFTIVNLEGTLTDSNDRADKLWNHKGKPEYIDILTTSSVEAVSLGNNHIMDYGKQGIKDTIETVENAGIVYALNTEWGDHVGLYETASGIKIGFVSINEHYEHEGSYAFLEQGYKTLRDQGAQLVIACNHWGEDKTHVPTELQLEMGKKCIDWGYDLVLGCHAHVLQGIEIYKGKYIVHSMGNFCYGGNKNPEDKDSMIWQQTFTFEDGVLTEDDARVIPCSLSSVDYRNDYCPIVLEDDAADALFNRLNKYCEQFNTRVDGDGHISQMP